MVVIKRKKSSLITPEGDVLLPERYDRIIPQKEGFLIVGSQKKWGLIQPDGKEIVPIVWDSIAVREDGFIQVWNDKLTGLYDFGGKAFLPPKYDHIGLFKTGTARVVYKRKWGAIRHDGHYVFDPGADYLSEFSDGIAAAGARGNFGFINHTGRVIIPAQFIAAKQPANGVAPVKFHPAGKWGAISTKTGKLVADTLFDSLSTFERGYALALQKGQQVGVLPTGESFPLKALTAKSEFKDSWFLSENTEGTYFINFSKENEIISSNYKIVRDPFSQVKYLKKHPN